MLRSFLAVLLFLVVSAPSVLGQRLARTFHPPDTEGLRFDVNNVPLNNLGVSASSELNFSPNVVFSLDGSKAFVSYTGYKQLAVFNPNTGQLITMLEVGENPATINLSPDGKTLGVVCLNILANVDAFLRGRFDELTGTIAMVDVDTLAVRTLELGSTFFSIVNNLGFSADGKTAYVASAATDEMIRINVESLTEISPRMVFEGGTRPATLTMAPDHSFLALVLVGSSALPQSEIADSVKIIDAASFTIQRSLVPPATEIQTSTGVVLKIPHDFTAINNAAISPDGRWLLIGDQENSLSSSLPELLSQDHAQVFDLETGEHVQFTVPGVAGPVSASPVENLFALVSATDVTFIDPEEQRGYGAGRLRSQYRETSRPLFSHDGDLLYLAAPVLDQVHVFKAESALLLTQVQVGRDFIRPSSQIPAGPLDLGLSPDGNTLAAVIFNADTVDMLTKSYFLTSPQLIAQNIDEIDSGGSNDPVIIPPGERFFSGLAVSNYGPEDSDVILTAAGSLSSRAEPGSQILIIANPNPVKVCEEGGFGKTTIQWNVTGLAEDVEVRVGAPDGQLLADGGETGSAETGEWVTEGMVFYLIDKETGEVLDTVTIMFTEIGCPPPVIEAFPNPVQVCDSQGVGKTNISWDTTDITDEVEIRVDTAQGNVLSLGGPQGAVQTGNWVTDGMTFYLLDHANGEVLDTVTVVLTDSGCPFSIREILGPDEQIVLTADDFLSTNSSLKPPFGDFDGWVDVDSDRPQIAGIFLTYDGDVNRIDGGPLTSDPVRVGILPEVRTREEFSTQVEVVNPTYTSVNMTFDLFDQSGTLVSSAGRTVVARDRSVFPVVGDPNDPEVSGLFDDAVGDLLISADPNPIRVCEGEVAQTTISWNATGVAENVEVRYGSPTGDILTTGGATGSQSTGSIVTNGMVFYLLDASTGEVLDSTPIWFTQAGCDAPFLVASPNPIRSCDDSTVGKTTLFWDTSGSAEEVQIRLGSAQGTLIASGTALGSIETGRIIQNGTVLYLMNAANAEVLKTLTMWLTDRGCPLADFEDGYMRVTSRGIFGFETYLDSRRMSVLAIQPTGQDDTHFTVPQFAAFGGTETLLKLIHPSSIPAGGGDEDDEEQPEADPILVSAALYGNGGLPIGIPATLELRDGESLRMSVVELFGLTNQGRIESGWIDIRADRPGLLGSAEIRIFNGEAMSSVPLQPVRDSKTVFAYVAQAPGFTTGIAVVNPGDEPAQVTLELRNIDAELIGIYGPTTLEAGSRIINTIPGLFPGVGSFGSGTVKVLSDRPLSSLELFYTDDLRILSAVPSQKMN